MASKPQQPKLDLSSMLLRMMGGLGYNPLIGVGGTTSGGYGPGGHITGGGPGDIGGSGSGTDAGGGPGSYTNEPHTSPWYRGTANTDINGLNPRPPQWNPQNRLQRVLAGGGRIGNMPPEILRAIAAARHGNLRIGDPRMLASGVPGGLSTSVIDLFNARTGKDFGWLSQAGRNTPWAINRLQGINYNAQHPYTRYMQGPFSPR